MSEQKHTPGPWSCREVGTSWDGERERLIAEVSAATEQIVDATYLEDARLIAAAPELFAQLSEAFHSVGKTELKDIFGSEWWYATEAALRKATGEQQ